MTIFIHPLLQITVQSSLFTTQVMTPWFPWRHWADTEGLKCHQRHHYKHQSSVVHASLLASTEALKLPINCQKEIERLLIVWRVTTWLKMLWHVSTSYIMDTFKRSVKKKNYCSANGCDAVSSHPLYFCFSSGFCINFLRLMINIFWHEPYTRGYRLGSYDLRIITSIGTWCWSQVKDFPCTIEIRKNYKPIEVKDYVSFESRPFFFTARSYCKCTAYTLGTPGLGYDCLLLLPQ